MVKYVARRTSKFEKSVQKLKKSGIDKRYFEILELIIEKLERGEKLEPKFRDHPLTGNYLGTRECHIRPDLLLVYTIIENELIYFFLILALTHNCLIDNCRTCLCVIPFSETESLQPTSLSLCVLL